MEETILKAPAFDPGYVYCIDLTRRPLLSSNIKPKHNMYRMDADQFSALNNVRFTP